MNVASASMPVSPNPSFYLLRHHYPPLQISFNDFPCPSCQREPVTFRWRIHNRAYLCIFSIDSKLRVFPEYSIELIAAGDLSSGKPNDQSTLFCVLDMVYGKKMTEKVLVMFLG